MISVRTTISLSYTLFFILAVSGWTACNKKGSETKSTSPLITSGEFHFAVSGEFKPFSYMNSNQELVGFDVDVGRAVAAELQLKPVVLKYKFPAMIEGIKSSRFDAAVASHTVTDERAEHVAFSTPYYYSGPQIFTRPGEKITDPLTFSGKEIGVSKGTTYEKQAKEITKNVKIYDNDITALMALAGGRHDAVITDFVIGITAIKEGMQIKPQIAMGRSAQAIALRKDNYELQGMIDNALKRLHASGKLKSLSEMYFGEDITETFTKLPK